MKLATILCLVLLAIGINADAWAQFCNDDNCSQGCGTWVAVGNPGCLGQYGRGSVKFKGTTIYHYALIFTPVGDGQCGCQNHCVENVFKNRGGCLKLTAASSFRFIGNSGICPENNC